MASRRSAGGLARGLGVALLLCLAGILAATPALAAAGAAVAVTLTTRMVWQSLQHRRLAQALRRASIRGTCHDIPVRWHSTLPGAAVAGLRSPEIFCHTDLTRRLGPAELEAVVLHERCHQLRRDPLRLLALSAAALPARLFPGGRQWLETQRAQLEIRADRYALAHGATRPALARALLALEPSAMAGTAAFTNATDLRLHALIHPDQATPPPGTTRKLLIVALAVLGTCGLGIAHHAWPVISGIGCLWSGC